MSDNSSLIAAAQAELDDARRGHEDAIRNLDAAKAAHDADANVLGADAEVLEAFESGTPEDREAAVFRAELANQPHADRLAAAYAEHGRVARAEHNLKRATFGLGPVGGPNLAPKGVTNITADIAVDSQVDAP